MMQLKGLFYRGPDGRRLFGADICTARNSGRKSQKVILWPILRLTFAADPDSV